MTDSNTDIGKIIADGGFGWWCESEDEEKVYDTINIILKADTKSNGMNSSRYLIKNYTCKHCYDVINLHMRDEMSEVIIKSNNNRPYQICKCCVMDTSDENIVFDENGICMR